MSLEPGQTLGHYRIEHKIGQGGMGVVFAAADLRLGRRVALKVLPTDVSGDPSRRARFEREARAIAALNHPNIVTLHSVEDADGITFLTMELVEGRRLSQLLTRDGLALPKLLEWSLSIADAMVAAHKQGVVHRDLKPDNVMVTDEGRVKVLDFGLAKLREASSIDEGGGAAQATESITMAGRILGTVAYMSPEQAEGKPLDHRSDIFSFGVLLYEMATGRRPFQGDTPISTITALLRDTPPPPQQVNAAVPPYLGRIVRRCLAKEPERRYQSTDDLRNELQEVREESVSGELSLERSAVDALPPVPLRSAPSRRRTRLAIAGALIVMALLAVAWIAQQSGRSRNGGGVAFAQSIQLRRATTDGKVQEAVISADGRYVAYVRREGALLSLRLRQLATGDEVQVVPPGEAQLTSPSFSADGNYLYYASIDPGRVNGWIHRASVLGGAPRRIMDGAFLVTASPDGRRLAVIAGTVDESHVRIAGYDGEAPQDLVSRTGRDHFDSAAQWSSDGRRLALVSHRYGEPQQIVVLDPETRREQPLSLPLHSFQDLSWMPGRDALVVAGSEQAVGQQASSQIWEVPLDGAAQPLTRDLNTYSDLSVTADGSTIAAVQVERRSGIDVAPVRDGLPGAFTELFPISAARAGATGIAWLGEGRLVHGMMQAETPQVLVTDIGTRATRSLTTGPGHRGPATSRDGRTAVVIQAAGDRTDLWRIDPDTGRGERLVQGVIGSPIVSSDGAWVIYTSGEENLSLFKVPATGGNPVDLQVAQAWCTDVSPNDQELMCLRSQPSGEFEGVLIPLAGGEPRRGPALVPMSAKMARFGPGGRSITYVMTHEGADELWSAPLSGAAPQRLVRFDDAEVEDFAWSPGGTQLAVVKVSRSGDVVLLQRSAP